MRYIQATGWFVLSLIMSCSNGTVTKYLGNTLNPWEIIFFRLGFGMLTLLPFMLYQGKQAFITHRWSLHVARGALLFIAMSLFGKGINICTLTTATTMSFSIPIIILLLSPILLKEHLSWHMWLATLGGLTGTLLVLQPNLQTFQQGSLLCLGAAILFALLDILSKKYINQESIWSMIFCPTVVAFVLTSYPTLQVWSAPSLCEWRKLFVLGIGNNLNIYFLLRAFALASPSSLVPFRYLELLMSMLVGYALFKEVPPTYSYIGVAIILLCTLFIGCQQAQHASNSQKTTA